MGNQSVMRCLIVFTALLLVARFGQGVPVRFEESVGASVSFESAHVAADDFQCVLTHFSKIYQVHPNSNLTYGTPDVYHDRCSVSLTSLKLKHAGLWDMTISWTVNGTTFKNTTKYELYLIHDVNTAYETSSGNSNNGFSTHFMTENGTYINVFPQKKSNIVLECLLVHNKAHEGIEIYDLFDFNQTYPNMELLRPCGVRMLINSSRTGYWYMKQETIPFVYEKFAFWVDIPFHPPRKSQENLLWLLGSTQTLKIDNLPQPTYCNLTRPDKKTILITDNSCTYKIPKVSRDHEGLWTLQYSLPEKIYLMKQDFMVEIHDPDYVNVSITYDLDLLLMCKITRKNSEFCIFTRPDGVTINLPQGIGNDRYEYYGNGYKRNLPDQETDSECGLRIRSPMNEDLGIWKCSLGHSGKILSANVYVYTEYETDLDYVFPSVNVYAKRSDNFTIKCQTSEQLDYCWLLSPNNTIYSVSTNKSSENTLLYEGEGLSLGVCGAKIENASDAHVGNWSCRMGTLDGIERQVPVLVTVTESYMYTNQSVIDISGFDNMIKLDCNVLPQKEATIRYCRWVRPDGYGIYKEISVQYITSQEARTCSLEIRGYTELDIGNWSCYAHLSDDLETEVFTTIEITRKSIPTSILNDVSTTLSTTIICLVTIIPVMLFVIGLILYKKKFCHRHQVNNIDYTTSEVNVQIADEKPHI